MSFLIDTNVISELRKADRCDARVARWFAGVDDEEIFLSVLTIGEIRRGIGNIHRRDARSAAALNRWLRRLVESFQDRILIVDRLVAEEWGRLSAPNPLPVIDGLLAATAKIHGLSLATRNTKHVARTGVSCFNPFSM